MTEFETRLNGLNYALSPEEAQRLEANLLAALKPAKKSKKGELIKEETQEEKQARLTRNRHLAYQHGHNLGRLIDKIPPWLKNCPTYFAQGLRQGFEQRPST